MISPGRCCDFSFEGLIACGLADLLRLVDSITSVSWTKRRSGLWVLNSVCMPQPAACRLPQKKRLVLNRELADLLGFSREMFEPGLIHIADKPHRLITHREICVHLAEVSTSENLHNCLPSTLLKSIPVENERCGGGRTETSLVLQYKRLASGPLSQLTLTILDTGGRKLGFNYLSAVLHIRRNG